MEASQSDQSMVGEMVSGSLEHSTTMCHPEEANTEHKERNVFLAEHSRTSRNEDCVSDDCEDVVSGEAFSSPLNYQDPVSGGGEASPGHLEDDNILEEEILTPSKTNLTFVALTPSPSGSRDRLQATSPSQRVIQVRKKSDLSLDERQEEGRRLSHRTPPSGAKIERSVVVDSPLLFLPVDLDILSLRDWDTDSMEGRKAALTGTLTPWKAGRQHWSRQTTLVWRYSATDPVWWLHRLPVLMLEVRYWRYLLRHIVEWQYQASFGMLQLCCTYKNFKIFC